MRSRFENIFLSINSAAIGWITDNSGLPPSFVLFLQRTIRVLGEIEDQLNESGISNMDDAKLYCKQELKQNKIVSLKITYSLNFNSVEPTKNWNYFPKQQQGVYYI